MPRFRPLPAKTTQRFAGWIRGYGMVYTLWPEPNPLSLEVSIEQKKSKRKKKKNNSYHVGKP